MESFAFDPLPAGPGHIIRVLRLEPGSGKQPLRGSLQLIDLDDPSCLAYDALSYVWGTDDPTKQIFLDGRALMIRPNLFDFLSSVGRKQLGRPIWTDAICIDQNNLAEKSAQVAMMGSIYEKSTCTRIWLGEPDLATRFFLECWVGTDSKKSKSPNSRDLRTRCILHGVRHAPRIMRPILRPGFQSIANNDYWTRLWIVQEVILPKRLVFHVGKKTFSWTHLIRRMDLLQKQNQTLNMRFRVLWFFLNQDREIRERTLAPSPEAHRIHSLMLRYGQNRCQDVRDRVFGLLGLAAGPKMIDVDYEQSAAGIFCVFAQKHSINFESVQIYWTALQVDQLLPRTETVRCNFMTFEAQTVEPDEHGRSLFRPHCTVSVGSVEFVKTSMAHLQAHSTRRQITWLKRDGAGSGYFDMIIVDHGGNSLTDQPVPCKILAAYYHSRYQTCALDARRKDSHWLSNALKGEDVLRTRGSSIHDLGNGEVCLDLSLTDLADLLPVGAAPSPPLTGSEELEA